MEDQNLVEKMIGRQLVYQGNPYQLWLDELQLPNGSEISRMHLHHPGGVAVLALDDQNRCAMVRQYRHPISQVTLEIPAGKLDKLPKGLDKGNGNEDCKKRNHSRNQEIKRRGKPMERSTNKTYHINYPPL